MRFMGNGITSCYPDKVDNFISITVLTVIGSQSYAATGLLAVTDRRAMPRFSQPQYRPSPDYKPAREISTATCRIPGAAIRTQTCHVASPPRSTSNFPSKAESRALSSRTNNARVGTKIAASSKTRTSALYPSDPTAICSYFRTTSPSTAMATNGQFTHQFANSKPDTANADPCHKNPSQRSTRILASRASFHRLTASSDAPALSSHRFPAATDTTAAPKNETVVLNAALAALLQNTSRALVSPVRANSNPSAPTPSR